MLLQPILHCLCVYILTDQLVCKDDYTPTMNYTSENSCLAESPPTLNLDWPVTPIHQGTCGRHSSLTFKRLSSAASCLLDHMPSGTLNHHHVTSLAALLEKPGGEAMWR